MYSQDLNDKRGGQSPMYNLTNHENVCGER